VTTGEAVAPEYDPAPLEFLLPPLLLARASVLQSDITPLQVAKRYVAYLTPLPTTPWISSRGLPDG